MSDAPTPPPVIIQVDYEVSDQEHRFSATGDDWELKCFQVARARLREQAPTGNLHIKLWVQK